MTSPLKVTPAVRAVMAAILDAPVESPPWGLSICDATGLSTGRAYPALNKLMRAGWITDRWEDPQPVSRPRRRFYEPAYNPEWYEERIRRMTDVFDYSDQSPEAVRRAAALVAEGCRFINHATLGPGGLKYPSDVDAVLVELDSLAERLPQLLDQMDRWVAGEDADGRIKVTHGPYKGAPAVAVADLGMHLRGASACLEGAREALHGARQVTAAMAAAGEDR